MAATTITLDEPPHRKLTEIADERGMTVLELVREVLNEGLAARQHKTSQRLNADSPVRRNFKSFGMGASGMSDMAQRTADEYVAEPFR